MAFDPNKVSGLGTSDIDPSVMGMPFINIIQKGSPEFDETHKNYSTKGIKDSRPGDIFFGPERRILKRPLPVLPLAQTAIYTEWKPRDQGGGFVGNRDVSVVNLPGYRQGNQSDAKQKYREYLGNNELVYTIFFAVLFKDGEKWNRGMLNFTSTQLRHARNWMKGIKSVKYTELPNIDPPIFAAQWTLDTAAENNASGSWFAWKIIKDRVLDFTKDEKLLELATEKSVDASAKLPRVQGSPAPAMLEAGKSSAKGADEDMPF